MNDADFLDMLEARVVAAKIEASDTVNVTPFERLRLYSWFNKDRRVSDNPYMGTMVAGLLIAEARKLSK